MAITDTIVTSRLVLSPFSEEYLTQRYVNWLNDPLVTRYSEQRHKTHTLNSCRTYWKSVDDSPNGFWAISQKNSDTSHIGNMTAHIDPANGVADLSILIGERSCWGQGFGLEAWTAVCSHLCSCAGVRKITAGTMAENQQMLTIMRRSGMHHEATLKRQFRFDGREVDAILMAFFPTPSG